MSASPPCSQRRSCTPKCHPYLPPLAFHSMPIAAPRRLSSDPISVHLFFDQSHGLLPPVDPGGGNSFAIPSTCTPIQTGVASVPGSMTLPLESISVLKLSADHSKEIFNLACEGRHLKEWVAREFAKLSSQEIHFHTQAQATSYEKVASRCPDHFTAYYMILRSDGESMEARDKTFMIGWVMCGCPQTQCCLDVCSITR